MSLASETSGLLLVLLTLLVCLVSFWSTVPSVWQLECQQRAEIYSDQNWSSPSVSSHIINKQQSFCCHQQSETFMLQLLMPPPRLTHHVLLFVPSAVSFPSSCWYTFSLTCPNKSDSRVCRCFYVISDLTLLSKVRSDFQVRRFSFVSCCKLPFMKTLLDCW